MLKDLLTTVVQYLEHPEVTKIPFAVRSEVVAQQCRKVIDSMAAGVTVTLTPEHIEVIGYVLDVTHDDQDLYLSNGRPDLDYGEEWPEVRQTKAKQFLAVGELATRFGLHGERERWNALANTALGVEACYVCGDALSDGGDGYDGLCPSCADKSDGGDDLCDECGQANVTVDQTDEDGGTVCTHCADTEGVSALSREDAVAMALAEFAYWKDSSVDDLIAIGATGAAANLVAGFLMETPASYRENIAKRKEL